MKPKCRFALAYNIILEEICLEWNDNNPQYPIYKYTSTLSWNLAMLWGVESLVKVIILPKVITLH